MAGIAPTASDKLRVWEKLEIVAGEGPGAGRYAARVQEVRAGLLVIDAPELIAGSHLLRNGAACTVVVVRDDVVYQFASEVTVKDEGGRRLFLLRAPGRLRPVQRRQFVRLDHRRRLSLALLGRRGAIVSSIERLSWHHAATVNISGGGLLIELPVKAEVDDLLLVKVDFFEEIGLPAMVAAVVRRVEKGERGLRAGIEFLRHDQLPRFFDNRTMGMLPDSVTFFNHIMQNKLVSYVYREQVKLRQKGLL